MSESNREPGAPIRIERRFAATLESLFRAWTTPDMLAGWAWGSLGKDVTVEVDLRKGGHYRIETTGEDGKRWAFYGTYEDVAPQERLAYTVDWEPPMPYPSPGEKVRVEFLARDDGTELLFIHEGVPDGRPREEHVRGWENTFDCLDELLGR
jgi:uncharacterized protein YndB with AHSA1/START domain